MKQISTLYFDFGNSRVKWSWDGWSQQGHADYSQLAASLQQIKAMVSVRDSIVLASVASEKRLAEPLKILRALFSVPIRRCLVTQEALGVRCGYSEFSRLGVDRWLALLAARKMNQSAVVVVDLGTAATLDVVDGAGSHLGGYIVSGMHLAVAGLLSGTDQIKPAMEQHSAPEIAFGRNTTQAVYNGSLRCLIALIKDVYNEVLIDDPEAQLVLTGGDAALIGPMLGVDYQLHEGLVFKGMSALNEHGITQAV